MNVEEAASDFLRLRYAAVCPPSCSLVSFCMMYHKGELVGGWELTNDQVNEEYD